MKVNKVDHLCIAVKNLEEARKIWEPVLGKSEPDDAYVDELEKIKVARYWVGEVGFELMESTTPDGDVAKFIEKRGEGIHHIAIEVDDIKAALAKMKSAGFQLIDDTPRMGAGNMLIAFVHPRSTNGVLLELCQPGK